MGGFSPIAPNQGIAPIARALAEGWAIFLATRFVSATYAMVFAIIGLVTLGIVEHARVAPMGVVLAGGFMLIGPILVVGFFSIADSWREGGAVGPRSIVTGFRRAPPGLWAIAAICMLLYLIWVTDAATLYGFIVGDLPETMARVAGHRDGSVIAFMAWSSLMGGVLAFVIYCISVFSVPLVYYRQLALVEAIVTSVATVFRHLQVTATWALILAVGILGSIFILPLFLVIFPVLAYGSQALYREYFPERRSGTRCLDDR